MRTGFGGGAAGSGGGAAGLFEASSSAGLSVVPMGFEDFQPASKMRVWQFAIHEKGYFSILQGLEMGWKWLVAVATRAKS